MGVETRRPFSLTLSRRLASDSFSLKARKSGV
jgi:hypothetical protein